MSIYSAQKTQITSLVAKEVIVLAKYSDFADVFSKKLAVELLERFEINEHLINLELAKQSPYGLIYSLKHVK